MSYLKVNKQQARYLLMSLEVKIQQVRCQWGITQRGHHVQSTWIRRGNYVDTSITKIRWIYASFPRTFFDVISLAENSTLFPRTFLDVISMVEKSTFFPRTFFDVISMVGKSTLLPRTLFDVISMVEKSTLFPRTLFEVISMVEICTLFLLTFFDVILMGKNSKVVS